MVERARIGIKVIDSLIEGGIPRKMSVAVQGPSGNEKYDLALSFLKEGIRKGEAVVIALSSISPEEFKRGMEAVGIDAEALEKEGLLRIIDWYSHKEKAIIDIEEDGGVLRCCVDLINVGIAFSRAIADLDESTKKRAVVEILSPALNEYDLQKVYGFAQSTKAKLEKMGFTSLFLVEKEMHDSVTLSTLLQPFDGVIDIERSREGDRIVRKVGALSMKDTRVDSNYVPLVVDDSGIREDVKEQRAKEAPEKTEEAPNTKDMQLWFDLGTRLLLQGEPERALKCFDKILNTDPSHVGAWASKANTLKELGIGIKESKDFSSPVYKLRLDMVGRILNQDPRLYADIEILNTESKKALRTYLKTSKKLLKIIQNKDVDGFTKYFKEAADYLGDFKKEAEEYSDYLIEKLVERKK